MKTNHVIVADTPGEANDAARTVTLLADLVVIPLQPSKPDVRAIKDTLTMIRLAQEMTGNARPRAVLVLTLVGKGSIRSRMLRDELTASGLSVAQQSVRRLNAFRDSCDTAVTRLPSADAHAAAHEVTSLFHELLHDVLTTLPRRELASGITGRAANE